MISQAAANRDTIVLAGCLRNAAEVPVQRIE